VNYRSLGSTGLTVSELGFGCGSVGGIMVRGEPADQVLAVERALDGGVTYFDTAPSYGNGRSEESLGRALAALSAWDRVVVGTKATVTTADLDDPLAVVRASVTESLRRLGHEHVDLLQLHSRIGAGGDRGLPAAQVIEGVASAMRAMVEEGLVGHIGITGLGETSAVLEVIRSGRFETVQAYFNALNPSGGFAGVSGGAQDLAGLIDVAAAAGTGVINIGAMVSGGEFEADLRRARALAELAQAAGLDGPVELGLRFPLAKAGISTVLIGFSDIDQVRDALRWVGRGPLAAPLTERVIALAGSNL
jgi:aryl-alcohol dehydrogenase-like predicted oxidoreductase